MGIGDRPAIAMGGLEAVEVKRGNGVRSLWKVSGTHAPHRLLGAGLPRRA